MSADMFMKIDGIKGESQDEKHPGEIDVLSWSWGATNEAGLRMGGGGGSGKVDVQDLTFCKCLDRSSTDLLLASCNGKHIREVVLTVRKSGENPHEYLLIKMNNVIVTSFTTGANSSDEVLTEEVALNFSKVKFEYSEQTNKGRGKSPQKVGWNIAENQKM